MKNTVKSDDTKQVMTDFVEQFTGLKKYISSDEEFKDPKNSQAIQSHLNALVNSAKKAEHNPLLSSENFKFSRLVLEDHLVEMERVFRMGNKSYARWMTNATLGICMSCHMQMPGGERPFRQLLSLKSFKTDFEKADFLFTARDFSSANTIFEKLILDYPKSNISATQLDTIIRRQVGYFSRILRSSKLGAEAMEKYLSNKQLPDYDRKNIKSWATEFHRWSKIPMPNPSTASVMEMIAFAKKQTSLENNKGILQGQEPLQISYLFVSGLLYEYLYHHPSSKETPDVLYWLAICDSGTSNEFFFSLADLYLRECITQYPGSAVAQQCFKEYETNTLLGYTGSSGTHVPSDVQEDLKRLKNWIDKKGQIPLEKKAP